MSNQNKTFVFVDVSNLIYGAKKSGGWKVNFKKLYKYLKERYQASKVFFYAGVDDLKNNKYLELKNIGFILKLKQIKKYEKKPLKKITTCPKCKFSFQELIKRKPEIKANCDVDLTFDAMKFLSEYSRMILVSGDGDFYPLIKFLIKKGRKVLVIGESSSTAVVIKKIMKGNFIDLVSIKSIIA